VAIYYLGMKTFGRNGGNRGIRATSAAAYRAGERIRDERTGQVYDHQKRRDVLHREIVLPARLAQAGRELDWARNRSTLWNAAEHAEVRRNARVAREFVVGLPHELSHEQRTVLAQRFAQEIADRYRSAVDVAIHAPRRDPRNFHAHLLATTREITAEGLGPKTTLELSGTERHRRGLSRWREETSSIRERWATLANEALEKARVAERVPYWSREAVRAQQLLRPRLPVAAYQIEQRGGRSFVGERLRAQQRRALDSRGLDRSPGDEKDKSSARLGPENLQLPPQSSRTRRLAHLVEHVRESWSALRSMLRGRTLERVPTPVVGQPQRLELVSRGERAKEAAREAHAREQPQQEVSRGPDGSREDAAQAAARAWLEYREARRLALERDDAQEKVKVKTREHDRDYDRDYDFGR